MDSKRRTSAPKSLGKTHSSSKPKEKKGSSPAPKDSMKKKEVHDGKAAIAQLAKKPANQLVKKKI
jgi:hypothetical protein